LAAPFSAPIIEMVFGVLAILLAWRLVEPCFALWLKMGWARSPFVYTSMAGVLAATIPGIIAIFPMVFGWFSVTWVRVVAMIGFTLSFSCLVLLLVGAIGLLG